MADSRFERSGFLTLIGNDTRRVMAALVAATHVFNRHKDVDPCTKSGDDKEAMLRKILGYRPL
jgi:hypothetical protein